MLYGASHPYGGPPRRRSQGDRGASPARTWSASQQRWLRPDNVKIFIVSDRPLAGVQPLLEARFGNWAPPAAAKGVKTFTAPAAAADGAANPADQPPRRAAVEHRRRRSCMPLDPKGDIVPFDAANDVLGGNFLSRLNMDLRETKGWSYGVSGDEAVHQHAVPYAISAPVQADRTGDSLAELNEQIMPSS